MQNNQSPTEKAFVQSIQAEIKSGKPPRQGDAVAYAAQKAAARKQAAAKKR
jgi:hypothetical protein